MRLDVVADSALRTRNPKAILRQHQITDLQLMPVTIGNPFRKSVGWALPTISNDQNVVRSAHPTTQTTLQQRSARSNHLLNVGKIRDLGPLFFNTYNTFKL